jgi:plasmid maintenance system antidote protein VapI
MNRAPRRFSGHQVKSVMDVQGRRYDWLAGQLDVPPYTVTRWFNNKTPILETQAQRISSILGVPFSLLFESHEWSDQRMSTEHSQEAVSA